MSRGELFGSRRTSLRAGSSSYVLRVYPRTDFAGGPDRLQNLIFEGSDTGETTGYTTLYTFPVVTYSAQWYEVVITAPLNKWVRLRQPLINCNVAEFEIWANGAKITPVTTFGTAPFNTGREFDKAFDDNTATYFDAAGANGYVGMQTGA